jgi:hypothetical protein
LGDIISAFTAVASMLLDLGHTRTTESESVTFNSSERIRGIRMAGRTRPETKKESVPIKAHGKKTQTQCIIVACCVFNWHGIWRGSKVGQKEPHRPLRMLYSIRNDLLQQRDLAWH